MRVRVHVYACFGILPDARCIEQTFQICILFFLPLIARHCSYHHPTPPPTHTLNIQCLLVNGESSHSISLAYFVLFLSSRFLPLGGCSSDNRARSTVTAAPSPLPIELMQPTWRPRHTPWSSCAYGRLWSWRCVHVS